MTAVETFVWRFLEKNLEVSVVILAVLTARFVMRNFPKKYSYVMWSIVGIRMLVEVPVRSAFSLFNFLPLGSFMEQLARGLAQTGAGPGAVSAIAETVLSEMVLTETMLTETMLTETMVAETFLTETVGTADVVADTVGIMAATPVTSGAGDMGMQMAGVVGETTVGSQVVQQGGIALVALLVLYLLGIYVVQVIGEISYLRFKKCIRQAVHLRENIWECDHISTPFVLGLLAPKIYIPFRMDKKSQVYVLQHEREHIRRGDPWVKLVAYVLLSVYWVNPLVWSAYFAFVRDQEMSCDETVIRMFGNESKREYSELLLTFATAKNVVGFSPITFGESEVYHRIKNVLDYKKPKIQVVILVVALIAAVAVGCLTNQTQSSRQITEMFSEGNPEYSEMNPEINSESNSEFNSTKGRNIEVQAKLEKLAAVYAQVEKQDAAREVHLEERLEAWTGETGGFEGWAKAMAGRDAETVLRLSTQEVQQQMQEEGLLLFHDGAASIRERGAWTSLDANAWQLQWSGWYRNDIWSEPRLGSAIIYYVIPTNNNRLISCRETIKVRKNRPDEDFFMEVYEEEMVCFEEISDYESFLAAYPRVMNNNLFDYLHNGYGALIQKTAWREPEKYGALFEPDTAALHLLNLTQNENQVQVRTKDYRQDNIAGESAAVEITFVETGKKITLYMSRPWGEKGIWAPENYL